MLMSRYYNTLDTENGDELYHYGVQGMKWGIRKYVNYDGSLTAEGRRRYGTFQNFARSKEGSKMLRSTEKDYDRAKRRLNDRVDVKKASAVGAGLGAAFTTGSVIAANAHNGKPNNAVDLGKSALLGLGLGSISGWGAAMSENQQRDMEAINYRYSGGRRKFSPYQKMLESEEYRKLRGR